MIWLFKVDEVFWNNTPKVNEYYTFDGDDIDFDINQYGVSLYFETSNYYLLSNSNEEEIYFLSFNGVNMNPRRVLLQKDDKIYNIIKKLYNDKTVENYENTRIN
jgi:hypothetical protein